MAFVNSVRAPVPWFHPMVCKSWALTQTAATGATTTVTISAPTGSLRRGYVRFKTISYPGGGTDPVMTGLKISITDGTSTRVIALYGTAVIAGVSAAAGTFFDVTVPFCLDFGGNTVSVAVTMANVVNGQMNFDVEVGANP